VPKGLSKKLRIRAEEVAHMLRVRGCVMVRDVVAMGFTSAQARYTLEYLTSAGRAVRVSINGVAMWCYSGNSAARHIHRLRRALHEALCRAGVRFATPRKALRVLMSDRKTSKIFSRYVGLKPSDTAVKDTAVIHLISGLLALAYDVVFYKRRPVYAVVCRKKLPPFRLEGGASTHVKLIVLKKHKAAAKPYRTISIKLDAQLKRDLMQTARALGISVSKLVRLAVALLLERYGAELNAKLETPLDSKTHLPAPPPGLS
jgi:hypothetical protein